MDRMEKQMKKDPVRSGRFCQKTLDRINKMDRMEKQMKKRSCKIQ